MDTGVGGDRSVDCDTTTALTRKLSGFVCAFYSAAVGSNPKHVCISKFEFVITLWK